MKKEEKVTPKKEKEHIKIECWCNVSGSFPSFLLSSPLNKRPLSTCSLRLFKVATTLVRTQSQGPFLPHKPTLPR